MNPVRSLKTAIQNGPYPLYLLAHIAWLELVERRRDLECARQLGLPALSTIDTNSWRKSSKLFVLGTGPSINQIDGSRWQYVARHDSVGINLWLAHPFRPSMLIYEAIADTTKIYQEVGQFFCKLATSRSDYGPIPKLISETRPERMAFVRNLPQNFLTNTYYSWCQWALARNHSELSLYLKYLKFSGFLKPGNPIYRFFKARSSVVQAISLGLKLGFEDIILCGIDLKRGGYFFDDINRYPHMADFPLSRQGALNSSGSSHSTFQASATEMGPVEFLGALNEMLKRQGVRIWVESTETALYPTLPQFPFPAE